MYTHRVCVCIKQSPQIRNHLYVNIIFSPVRSLPPYKTFSWISAENNRKKWKEKESSEFNVETFEKSAKQ